MGALSRFKRDEHLGKKIFPSYQYFQISEPQRTIPEAPVT